MQAPLCNNNHTETAHGRSDFNRGDVDWTRQLPARWRELAVTPVRFDRFHDYEIAAERTIGYDEGEAPCYCAYSVLLTDTRSDDDEEFYTVAVYAESVTSWCLRDGRWLIHHLIAHDDAADRQARGFYSLGEAMPR